MQQGLLIEEKSPRAYCEHCEKNVQESYCSECDDSFCKTCFESEHKTIKKMKHQKKPLEMQKMKCKIHYKPLENYCFDCDLQLCVSCVLENHKDHNSPSFEKAEKKIKENLFEAIKFRTNETEIKKEIDQNQNKIQSLKKEMKLLEEKNTILKQKLLEYDQERLMIESTKGFQNIFKLIKELNTKNVEHIKCIKTIHLFEEVNSILILPNNHLLIASESGITVWGKDYQKVKVLKFFLETLKCLTLLSNGIIISGSRALITGVVKTIDINNEIFNQLFTENMVVNHIFETKDGNLLVASQEKFKLWNMNGKEIQRFEGHSGKVTGVVETSDELIISSSLDKTIKFWNKNGKCIKTILDDDSINALLITKEGSIVFAVGEKIRIYNKDGEKVQALYGHTDQVNCLIENKDGYIVSGSSDRSIRFWNRYGICIKSLNGNTLSNDNLFLMDGPVLNPSKYDKEGHSDIITYLIESNDGGIISGSKDKTVKIWN